ncbi:hypothetical protein [Micromonospora sp. CA-246542]|uniref:hypothetical protein n=1 Tax=Micromonospora sp. CA-246542 TaxID=3239959 RepID=UPI003D89EED0
MGHVLTYVRWYSTDDDRWNYEKLDAYGWALRHVEMRVSDGVVVAAASLATLDPALENVSPGKFEHLWRNARRQLERQTGA